MNTKNIVVVLVVVILILLAVTLLNRKDTPTNDLSRSLDEADDNIDEGLKDAEREVKDALD